jgi:hypothetical protein
MGSGLRMAVRRVDPAAAGRSRVLSHTDGHSARRLASPRVNKPAAAGARTDVLQHLRLARAFGGPPVSRRRVSTTLKWYPVYLVLLFGISGMTYRFIEFRSINDWRQLFLLYPTKNMS